MTAIPLPWERNGFQQEINQWVSVQLGNSDLTINSCEQIKASDMSFIKRFSTEINSFYLKCTHPSMRFEGELCRHIYKGHPENAVGVTAIHPEQPWFLMEELKGKPLRTVKDKVIWQKALQRYAELQVKETKHAEKLISLGVPDRRMPVLKAQIDEYLEEMCGTGLNPQETKEIMNLVPELLDMGEQMDGSLPYSLDHGDLHTANIYYDEGRYLFFDWGDGSVTHPFFSSRIFWNSLYDLIPSDSEWLGLVDEFRPYYLEPWEEFASRSELERLLKVSDQLGCVHRALGWHLYINPYRLDKEETRRRPAQWLQVLLEYRELNGK